MGFNRIQLTQYFDNLEAIMKKYNFSPNQIFNMDETGVQTVPNILPKHVAPTGKKEVAKAVAAEQGQTVSAVKRENRLLIKGGPLGCEMAVTDKGYMNTPTFIKWLNHFKKYAKPSDSNPILLILDNHVSHTSLEAVSFAKSNNIHLLTLPPHSSRKTQPLDRCIFRPLKAYYDAAVDSWDVSHPGETFSVYNVAESFKIAFEKASSVENAAQAFKTTEPDQLQSLEDIASDRENYSQHESKSARPENGPHAHQTRFWRKDKDSLPEKRRMGRQSSNGHSRDSSLHKCFRNFRRHRYRHPRKGTRHPKISKAIEWL
ncbi:uncharacterized protein LOC115889189 [Sitophilus oryzae]|uniref:Uncharacterized protein LOC115889189 n=1 Tax=Sitophilus oryzae TaxID=7048 RepID=A0A6J2YLV8_SITOR|nr:uncharacterized protein LOC115889189 [Sitophilus oryzae]